MQGGSGIIWDKFSIKTITQLFQNKQINDYGSVEFLIFIGCIIDEYECISTLKHSLVWLVLYYKVYRMMRRYIKCLVNGVSIKT